MLTGPRNLFRLVGIVLTLARHRALFPLRQLGFAPVAATVEMLARFTVGQRSAPDSRPGERLAAALTELGPTFIKLGQSLATRADLIGEDFAADLSALQDRLPPFPGDQARAAIETELGAPLEHLFSEFDERSVAAASIAQVHFATTTDGLPVAVKVLRPGIEAAFARDLELLRWLAGVVLRLRPLTRRLKPREVVEIFARVVALEMDLRMEAAAASEIGENFAGDGRFRVPEIDWRRTGRRVLTLARVDGIPIDERDRIIAAGIDPNDVLKNAANAFFLQVFRDGVFHADLHPGNLFVAPDGAVQAVDFGIVGRLDMATRRYLGEMLLGFLDGDFQRVADVHFRAGYIPADQSRDEFTQACRAIGQPILGRPMSEISVARLLGQLFAVTETFQMETQPQLLLLQKSMMIAEGVGRQLNDDVNMWEMSRPLTEEWIRDNLGPEAMLRTATLTAVEHIERLPRTLRAIEEAANRLAATPTAGERDAPARRGIGRALWVIAALLGALLAVVIFKF